MQAYLINNDSDCLDSLQQSLSDMKINYQTASYAEINQKTATDADLVVLSGGIWYPEHKDQLSHYRTELELISSLQVPILGICLGMLLIASDFGVEPVSLSRRQAGRKSVSFTDVGQQLYDMSRMNVEENHSLGLKSAPDSFSVLANSDAGIEVIEHQTRPILGVQFHPELTSGQKITQFWRRTFAALGLNEGNSLDS